VQHALPELLAAGTVFRERVRRRTAANLEFLRSILDDRSGCRVLDVEGGWYAVVQVPGLLSEDEWTLTLLERDGVLVQPGYFFDFESEAFLVVSLLTPADRFREGTRKLAHRVASAT
jgi:aspartate/methionine/tyrosine aminotransferase